MRKPHLESFLTDKKYERNIDEEFKSVSYLIMRDVCKNAVVSRAMVDSIKKKFKTKLKHGDLSNLSDPYCNFVFPKKTLYLSSDMQENSSLGPIEVHSISFIGKSRNDYIVYPVTGFTEWGDFMYNTFSVKCDHKISRTWNVGEIGASLVLLRSMIEDLDIEYPLTAKQIKNRRKRGRFPGNPSQWHWERLGFKESHLKEYVTSNWMTRGHWRRQPYGYERRLEKLVYIKPHMKKRRCGVVIEDNTRTGT